jgi:hypothetical protein
MIPRNLTAEQISNTRHHRAKLIHACAILSASLICLRLSVSSSSHIAPDTPTELPADFAARNILATKSSSKRVGAALAADADVVDGTHQGEKVKAVSQAMYGSSTEIYRPIYI